MERDIAYQNQLMIEEDDEIDLIDLLKTLYKNRKLIIIITLVITALGLIFALATKKTYKSEMTFIEQKSTNTSSMLASLSASIPFGLGSSIGGADKSSLVTVIDSRTFRERVAQKLNIREYIIATNKIDLEGQQKFDKQDVTNWIKSVVTINQDAKTDVYKIEVELEDKVMATKIANAYYYILDDYLKNSKLDKSKINREYLEKQVISVEKDLHVKQNILKAYEEEYNSVSIDADAKIVAESVATVKGEIIKTESELNIARAIAGEESLDVIKLKDTLVELKRQLNNFKNGTGTVNFIPLNDIPKIKYELEKLSTEITATVEVYKMMKIQLEQAKLDEVNKRSVIELLDEAVIPKLPSSTSKLIILVISGILGLFIGIFTAFVKEFAKGINWSEFKN